MFEHKCNTEIGFFYLLFQGILFGTKTVYKRCGSSPPSACQNPQKRLPAAQAFSTSFELKFGSTFERLAPNLP